MSGMEREGRPDPRKAETVEVCVAALNLDMPPEAFVRKTNIQTDCIIADQCGRYAVEETEADGHRVTVLHTAERGVGLNRNNAWMRAKGDIVLFCDDDMVYEDGYAEKVLEVFRTHPEADVVLFNILEPQKTRRQFDRAFYTKKIGFGAVRIAVRRVKAQMHGIAFPLHFGGGCAFSHGEDTLFLAACVREGLKMLVWPEAIARLTDERPSTWASGDPERRAFDDGVLDAAAGTRFPLLITVLSDLKNGRFSLSEDYRRQLKRQREGMRYFRSL